MTTELLNIHRLEWLAALQNNQEITFSAMRVALCMATTINSSDGLFNPSLATIELRTSLSKRKVQRAIANLIAIGALVEIKTGNAFAYSLSTEVRGGSVPIDSVKGDIQSAGSTRSFKPPTQVEVFNYMQTRSFSDPGAESEKFCDHYASNGWKVGKNKMKDWQAAVRNWERNWKGGRFAKRGNETKSDFVDRATGTGERLKQSLMENANDR